METKEKQKSLGFSFISPNFRHLPCKLLPPRSFVSVDTYWHTQGAAMVFQKGKFNSRSVCFFPLYITTVLEGIYRAGLSCLVRLILPVSLQFIAFVALAVSWDQLGLLLLSLSQLFSESCIWYVFIKNLDWMIITLPFKKTTTPPPQNTMKTEEA